MNTAASASREVPNPVRASTAPGSAEPRRPGVLTSHKRQPWPSPAKRPEATARDKHPKPLIRNPQRPETPGEAPLPLRRGTGPLLLLPRLHCADLQGCPLRGRALEEEASPGSPTPRPNRSNQPLQMTTQIARSPGRISSPVPKMRNAHRAEGWRWPVPATHQAICAGTWEPGSPALTPGAGAA